ncbi:lipoprotein signal peptidase [Apibacter muscae]|uniref:Lipoprotein signal peptidase n=1 Tax=Apibacter muscae TaxID=2509004 RepID=A0A563DFS6_9FLAO|nr:lipoprotein signal peptidase [Apibacter muscae]TWP29106.1 lipoprotein signal peptidase [Apibacter muscae]
MKKVLWITFIILFIDQASKIYIKTHFHLGEQLPIIGSWCNLTYVENPGMAYGVQLGGFLGKIGLSILRLVLISFMAYYISKWVKKANSWYFIIPAGLIFAGAIGNLIDSIFYGVMFDTGTTYNALSKSWSEYHGISKLDFKGYAPLFGGCVVDMFHFPIIDTHLPSWVPIWGGNRIQFFNYIFNVADSSITIGAILLALIYFFKPNALPKEWLK